ncbi:hypothetical protein C8R45DRAFT_1076410 [Mycena sanguinolenta]|nr:hypothetical protein C8R45DRAFT_1076410 [Mycena sanguinolenta]
MLGGIVWSTGDARDLGKKNQAAELPKNLVAWRGGVTEPLSAAVHTSLRSVDSIWVYIWHVPGVMGCPFAVGLLASQRMDGSGPITEAILRSTFETLRSRRALHCATPRLRANAALTCPSFSCLVPSVARVNWDTIGDVDYFLFCGGEFDINVRRSPQKEGRRLTGQVSHAQVSRLLQSRLLGWGRSLLDDLDIPDEQGCENGYSRYNRRRQTKMALDVRFDDARDKRDREIGVYRSGRVAHNRGWCVGRIAGKEPGKFGRKTASATVSPTIPPRN